MVAFLFPNDEMMKMARRTEIVEATIGRDAGKKYLITEMSAEGAEWWATRAIMAMASTDFDIEGLLVRDDAGNIQTPLADLARKGLKALMSVDASRVKPLLDEMMGCVQMSIPGGARKLLDGDIEEVKTRFELRQAIMAMHVGFFIGGDDQTSQSQS